MLGGGLAGSTVLDQKGAEHARPATSSPASGSTCTTRTWASSPSAAREAGVVIPLGAVVAQLMALAARQRRRRPRPLRRCCAASSGCPARPTTDPTPDRAEQSTTMPRMTPPTPRSRSSSGRASTHAFGLPGAAINPFYSAMRDARRDHAHPGPPRRGRLAHGRGLHPGRGRQHRRLRRHLRPGRHRHDHRPVLGLRRLDPDPVHHRPGAGRPAAQGGLPGRRHRRRSPRR